MTTLERFHKAAALSKTLRDAVELHRMLAFDTSMADLEAHAHLSALHMSIHEGLQQAQRVEEVYMARLKGDTPAVPEETEAGRK